MAQKVYVITGGASGIGLSSAICMQHEGIMLLVDRDAEMLKRAKKELVSNGARAETFLADIRDPEAVKACSEFAASLGDIYAVINSAGVSPANAGADEIIDTNALGNIYIVNTFYPLIMEGGVLICISSKASYMFDQPGREALIPILNEMYLHWDEPDFTGRIKAFLTDIMKLPEANLPGTAYCVTKNFVKYFVKMNVWRFAKKNCRILSVSPGSIMTPLHEALLTNLPESAEQDMLTIPMGRWGRAYELGYLVEFLCSNGAGYMSGVDVLCDCGSLNSGVPQLD